MFGRAAFFAFILLFFPFCTFKKNQEKVSENKNSNIFYLSLSSQPPTLHPIRSTDANAFRIHRYVMESLAGRSVHTYQLEPSLAESWKIEPDNLTYTFFLRKGVTWHDGKPLTAEDVKFSFDAVQDISYGGAHFLSYFENISKAEVIGPHTIRFYAKEKYYGTFEKLSTGLPIIPKHIYKGKKAKLNRILVGSGPYMLHQYDGNKKIVLKKNKNWWGGKLDQFKGQYNFGHIVFRIIQNTHDELIRMSKGQLDFLSLTAESYFKKTNDPPWEQTVFKKKIENLSPKGYSFIGWNLKRPLFQSLNVRNALSYLINRPLMNEKFQNSSSNLLAGPVYPKSDYTDPNLKPILFSPDQALNLLNKEGWKDSDQNGILDKVQNGVKTEFRFTLIFPSKDFEKYLTIYQEDLKRNGIIMSLKYMEWVSFIKLLDEGNFDAITLAWIITKIEWYPKQIWHSSSIKDKGSNFIGYSNPEVDRLIDVADRELNRDKRIQILRKVYRIIAEDQPYSFLFSSKYQFYAYSNRVGMDKPTYKYKVDVLRYWYFLSNEIEIHH